MDIKKEARTIEQLKILLIREALETGLTEAQRRELMEEAQQHARDLGPAIASRVIVEAEHQAIVVKSN